MRRLPIFLIIDVSESMMGDNLRLMQSGIEQLTHTLRQDPYALETAFLSIISFDTAAKQLMPLTEIAMFNPPALQAAGATQLGEALALLADKISQLLSQHREKDCRSPNNQPQ